MKAVWISLLLLVFLVTGTSVRTDDFCFLVVSDSHYGKSDRARNQETIQRLNSVEGNRLPGFLQGKTREPLGVIHCGDILDNPDDSAFRQFEEDYGLTGESRLRFPVYETFGNHDGGTTQIVRKSIVRRNTGRPGVSRISDNGLHYSWDWNGVHFVSVGSYPGNEWIDTCGWCHYFKDPFREPEFSRDFLRKDLQLSVGSSGRPVVIIQHYGWDDFSKLWWTIPDRDSLAALLKPYRVAAIFHGHSHAVEHRTWMGIPIWSAGSTVKEGQPGDILYARFRKGQIRVWHL